MKTHVSRRQKLNGFLTSGRSQLKIILPPSFLWLFAGFDLALLPLFSVELGRAYFPSDNPINSILAVYGTFSLSLLMRVFGGICFGALSDTYGRKAVTMMCSWFLTIIMIISALLPSAILHPNTMDATTPTILFIITRVLIGFFVGGLWPSASILAMENLYDKFYADKEKYENWKEIWEEWSGEKNEVEPKDEEEYKKWQKWENSWEECNKDFEHQVKRLTIQSSILQVWLFLGYLVTVVLVIHNGDELANTLNSLSSHLIPLHLPLATHFNDFPLWRSMSLIAGIIGLVFSLLCRWFPSESYTWDKWNKGWNKGMHIEQTKTRRLAESFRPGIATLLKAKEYREILFSLWLIMTGLMYMYYSTIVTAPELFIRDSISTMVGNANPIQAGLQQNFFEILLIMMAVAHIWVGIYCHIKWKRFDRQRSNKNIFSLDFILRRWRHLTSLFQYLFLDHKYSNNKNISTLDNAGDDLDVRLITWLGIILVPMGIIFCVLFVIIQPDKSNGFCAVIITSFVILVANAAWALIPSILSSRFPIHLRGTGASLAYNGGLVISFASPFIIIEFYIHFKNEYVIFVAMILGALSMIIGGIRLIRKKWERPREYRKSSLKID